MKIIANHGSKLGVNGFILTVPYNKYVIVKDVKSCCCVFINNEWCYSKHRGEALVECKSCSVIQ